MSSKTLNGWIPSHRASQKFSTAPLGSKFIFCNNEMSSMCSIWWKWAARVGASLVIAAFARAHLAGRIWCNSAPCTSLCHQMKLQTSWTLVAVQALHSGTRKELHGSWWAIGCAPIAWWSCWALPAGPFMTTAKENLTWGASMAACLLLHAYQ